MTFVKSLLGDIKQSTIQRNARRSQGWFLTKIKSANRADVKQSTRPIIGKMYTFVYNPKTKETLPYYDTNPLIIVIGPAKGGFYGLNFHYLPIKQRHLLLKEIGVFQDINNNKDISKIQISYRRLVALSSTYWKHAIKRYLTSHMKTKFIDIPYNEWSNIIELPLAHFVKADKNTVYRDMKSRYL